MTSTMPLTRRLALPLLATLLAAPAFAQGAYPDKPVTVVVPQGAGGANDAIARIVVPKLATLLQQSVVIDNRPGAGGNIGTAYAAKARPDGYTLVLTTNSAHVVNPWLYKNIGFDPVKDFAPIGTVATAGYVLVANPSFPANSVKELVARVKAAPPGSISYASAGNGTLNHLIGEMLKKQAGIEMVHVPYRTSAAAVTDVVGGQLPLSVQSLPSSIAFIKANKLKVLAVANEKRIAALPDVPTLGETLPGLGTTPWYGLLAPAGTPKPVIDRLQAALAQVLDSKDVQEQLAAQGCEVFRGTPAAFATLIRTELPQWEGIVKASGATLD
ncbi:MAG: tripartite tricarboxylate transporter substrate binding protein [Variovorax sp.]|jgi:tripartite-type tricarboxylate transporter receptor subunit TctC|nr:MAG: tripartite tricarboxylate transporter substrate binding protein [Variovorax sp.]